MDSRLTEIVEFLDRYRIRASYGAVAQVLGVVPRSMGARLGPHYRAASWIVNASTGRPTGYAPEHIHPDLTAATPLIRDAADLIARMERVKGAANSELERTSDCDTEPRR